MRTTNQTVQWITSLKPEKTDDKTLEAINPLLEYISKYGYDLKLLNSISDIPKNSKYSDFLCKYEGDSYGRPNLRSILSLATKDYFFLSNADIIFDDCLEKLYHIAVKNKVSIVSGRRIDVEKSFINSSRPFSYPGKLQSKRTLDWFLICRRALEHAVEEQPDFGNLVLGTIKFDNYLFSGLSSLGPSLDATKANKCFHYNHESFRYAYKRNFIICLDAQKEFSKTRRAVNDNSCFNIGCLTQATLKLDRKLGIQKRFLVNKLLFRIESLRVALENRCEILTHRWNVWILKNATKNGPSRRIRVYDFKGFLFIFYYFSTGNGSEINTLEEAFVCWMQRRKC